MEIKKAIIPAAGLGTRFLPWTKIVAKEILPLVDRPMIAYSAKEAKDSGIDELILVLSKEKKALLDYFKHKLGLERILEDRQDSKKLEVLQAEQNGFEGMAFFSVLQAAPKGDGDAVLKAKKIVAGEPFAVLFPDDVHFGDTPAISQLIKVFETSDKTVVGLKKVSQEKISSYGSAKVEKIANRLYRLKDFIEKPEPKSAPSDLVCCGRYVFTNEIFDYLKKVEPNKKGEIILADAIKLMIDDGKMIYGYEIENEWLECGKTIDWLKSNLFLALRHKEYGPALKQWLKNNLKF